MMPGKCECKNRRKHETLSAQVCIDCGRRHFRLDAETGHYNFSGKDLGAKKELPRDKWGNN
jgi:hypothetical protein